MKFVRALIELVVIVLLILIGVQNYEVVAQTVTFRLDLGFLGTWQIGPISVGVLFIVALLFGGLFVGFYGFFEYMRLRRKYKEALERAEYGGRESHPPAGSRESYPLPAEPVEEDES